MGLLISQSNHNLKNQLFPNNHWKILLEAAQNHSGVIYGLRDDAAIIVNNDKHYDVGSKAVKIIDGKLAQE